MEQPDRLKQGGHPPGINQVYEKILQLLIGKLDHTIRREKITPEEAVENNKEQIRKILKEKMPIMGSGGAFVDLGSREESKEKGRKK